MPFMQAFMLQIRFDHEADVLWCPQRRHMCHMLRSCAHCVSCHQLAARRAEVLEAVVPDMLRTKHLQLGLVMDQLVAQQRAKCVGAAVHSIVVTGPGICRHA